LCDLSDLAGAISPEIISKLGEEINKPLKHVRVSSNDKDFDVDTLQCRAILNRFDYTKYNPSFMTDANRQNMVDMLRKKWFFLQL